MPVNHNDLPVQVEELQADVRHIQADTTELKAEMLATNQRLERLKDSLTSAKIWALLGICIAFWGAVLYAMARGFKWL